MDEKVTSTTQDQSESVQVGGSTEPDTAQVQESSQAAPADTQPSAGQSSAQEPQQQTLLRDSSVEPPDPAKDPRVQEMIQQAIAKAAKESAKKERERLEQEQARAKMEEVDRVRAEKEDMEKERDTYREQIARLESDNAYNSALIANSVRLVGEDAAKFLRMKVDEIRSGREIGWQDAIGEALKSAPFLVKKEEAAAAPAPVPPPSTVPTTNPVRQGTEAPAEKAPEGEVDVLKMSPQQFAQYKMETYKISH